MQSRINLDVCEVVETLNLKCMHMLQSKEPKGTRVGPMQKLEAYLVHTFRRVKPPTPIYGFSPLNLVGLVVDFSYVRKTWPYPNYMFIL